MPSQQILYITKQVGKFSLDETACYEDMKGTCEELLQQHRKDADIPQPMFRCVDGILQIYGGEENEFWGTSTNIWGYSPTWILKTLSKHLKGDGSLIFISSPQYRHPEIHEVGENRYTLTEEKHEVQRS